MPVPKLHVTDLKREAIELFKEKALRRHRLTGEEARIDDTILMELTSATIPIVSVILFGIASNNFFLSLSLSPTIAGFLRAG